MWNERSAGKGAIIVADNKIILRTERGPVSLVKLSPTGYEEVSRFDQPERTRARAWAHPVVLDGKLYLRDQDNILSTTSAARTLRQRKLSRSAATPAVFF